MSGGSSGSSTPAAQNTTSVTQLPSWYNDLVQSLGQATQPLIDQTGAINQQMMQGGTQPAGGVFNGGMTGGQATAPVQPYWGIPGSNGITTAPGAPVSQGVQSFGGNGFGTGIGKLSGGGTTGGALSGGN